MIKSDFLRPCGRGNIAYTRCVHILIMNFCVAYPLTLSVFQQMRLEGAFGRIDCCQIEFEREATTYSVFVGLVILDKAFEIMLLYQRYPHLIKFFNGVTNSLLILKLVCKLKTCSPVTEIS